MFKNALVAVWVLASLAPGVAAEAWSPNGHRIIAYIAEEQLPPAARERLRKKFNIKRLADVAHWADSVKNRRRQGPWHYVNVAEGQWTYKPRRDCPRGRCVVEKIKQFARRMSDSQLSGKQRKEAAMYLIHFVGDVHQPLHVGNRKDKGGNKIRLVFRGRPTNLHALWDGRMLDTRGMSLKQYAHHLSARIKEGEARRWAGKPVNTWADESRKLALSKAYGLLVPGAHRLEPKYVRMAREIMDLRLAQAGVRLAFMLKDVLKN